MAVFGSPDYLKKLSLAALLVITACAPNAPTTETEAPPKAEAPPTPSVEDPPIKDLTFFDDIVTPEAVFPDPKARALFEAMPPETTEKGWRGYGFILSQQPGMKPNRHFYIVTVTWAPAGTFQQGLTGGMFGPSGGSAAFAWRTADDKYDLRISVSTLLPNTVIEPEFDVDAVAEQLLLRYSQKLNNSLEGK